MKGFAAISLLVLLNFCGFAQQKYLFLSTGSSFNHSTLHNISFPSGIRYVSAEKYKSFIVGYEKMLGKKISVQSGFGYTPLIFNDLRSGSVFSYRNIPLKSFFSIPLGVKYYLFDSKHLGLSVYGGINFEIDPFTKRKSTFNYYIENSEFKQAYVKNSSSMISLLGKFGVQVDYKFKNGVKLSVNLLNYYRPFEQKVIENGFVFYSEEPCNQEHSLTLPINQLESNFIISIPIIKYNQFNQPIIGTETYPQKGVFLNLAKGFQLNHIKVDNKNKLVSTTALNLGIGYNFNYKFAVELGFNRNNIQMSFFSFGEKIQETVGYRTIDMVNNNYLRFYKIIYKRRFRLDPYVQVGFFNSYGGSANYYGGGDYIIVNQDTTMLDRVQPQTVFFRDFHVNIEIGSEIEYQISNVFSFYVGLSLNKSFPDYQYQINFFDGDQGLNNEIPTSVSEINYTGNNLKVDFGLKFYPGNLF
ncbi:MAG: hypothetical protein JXL97_02130 [Bacteroidales bacterium]|nr:hypothetical protein [Bacteroidales bacterium]